MDAMTTYEQYAIEHRDRMVDVAEESTAELINHGYSIQEVAFCGLIFEKHFYHNKPYGET